MSHLVNHLHQALAANATATQPLSRGFLLLLALVGLLGAFLVAVLLVNLARRNRRRAEDARRAARSNTKPAVDPWYEAGRRAKADQEER